MSSEAVGVVAEVTVIGSRWSWCTDFPNNADTVLSPAHNLQVITTVFRLT